jgi:peptide/nickel transport system permease protein
LTDSVKAASSGLLAARSSAAGAAAPASLGARRWRTTNWELIAGAALLIAMLLLVTAAPLLTSVDPRALALSDRLSPPSAAHPFGADDLGRDLLARVLYGGRVSLSVGVAAASLSTILGGAIGVIAPMSRWLDNLAMRLVDGIMSIPAILLAIALVAIAGASVRNVIIAVVVVEAPRIARVIRAEVLSLRRRLFIDAAITAGSSTARIMWRHLLPGVAPQLAVQATFVWAAAMLIESGLSFVGAGTPPTTPSWGNIMADGRALWQIRPNLIFIPAAFLSVSLVGVNLMGEGLRKALNPREARS